MSAIEVHRVVSQPRQTADVALPNKHRLLIRPIAQPQRTIDATDSMTRAIAHFLWEHVGGNDALNWLEAERVVQEMLGRLNGNESVVDSQVDAAFAIDEQEATAQRARMTIEPKDGAGASSITDADLAGEAVRQAA